MLCVQNGTSQKDYLWGRKSKWQNSKFASTDGAGYEQMMGIWSRFAGEIFLDWLALPLGLRWIDIGCGKRGLH
jgi:hypothetical protein